MMTICSSLRFLIGWPLWAVAGLAICLILWRHPPDQATTLRVARVLAIVILLHSIVSWSALLSGHGVTATETFTTIYTGAVLMTAAALAAVAIRLFAKLWRRHDE